MFNRFRLHPVVWAFVINLVCWAFLFHVVMALSAVLSN